ncbi:hypothetical protein M0R45_017188 [Rubus argutus]|uniref:Uncharacterized protein n=1 Tax=Rubus argutus TaxID=59490 RepID=A0AAW1XYB5_RUBAR
MSGAHGDGAARARRSEQMRHGLVGRRRGLKNSSGAVVHGEGRQIRDRRRTAHRRFGMDMVVEVGEGVIELVRWVWVMMKGGREWLMKKRNGGLQLEKRQGGGWK